MASVVSGLTIGLPALNILQAAIRSWASNRWDKFDDFMDATNWFGLTNSEEANHWAGAVATNIGAGITGFAVGKGIQYASTWKKKNYRLDMVAAKNPLRSITSIGGSGGGASSMMAMMLMNQVSSAATQYLVPKTGLTEERITELLGLD
jgi:hypothetical protein